MCKFNPKNDSRRIDPCMKDFIEWLGNKHRTVACCCGHGKYPMTVIVKEIVKNGLEKDVLYLEIISGTTIPRTKRFYKKDKQGIYYIPEVVNGKKEEK